MRPSGGSGQDHNPTPLAEKARIAHHSETNPSALKSGPLIFRGVLICILYMVLFIKKDRVLLLGSPRTTF